MTMKAKYRIFNILCLGPMTFNDLVERTNIPYNTVYKAIHELKKDELISKQRIGKEVKISVASTFKGQKFRNLFLKARRSDIDPERMLSSSFMRIWRCFNNEMTLEKIMNCSNLSYPTVYRIVQLMIDWGLARVIKKKPLKVKLTDSDINLAYEEAIDINVYQTPKLVIEEPYMKRVYTTPYEVERQLFQNLRSTSSLEVTGPVFLGDSQPIIYYPIKEEDSPESIFLNQLLTVDGIEDICVRMVNGGLLNYDKLIDLAHEKGLLGVLGCYLNILSSLKGDIVPEEVLNGIIEKFKRAPPKKVIFLKSEKRHRKSGWEFKFERKWNVNLYLDIGAIRHTVRSL